MDRRKFMALTGLSATTLGVGGLLWRVGGVWWDQDAAPEWQIFSQHEVKIVEAIASTICSSVFSGASAALTALCARATAAASCSSNDRAAAAASPAIDRLLSDWSFSRRATVLRIQPSASAPLTGLHLLHNGP